MNRQKPNASMGKLKFAPKGISTEDSFVEK